MRPRALLLVALGMPLAVACGPRDAASTTDSAGGAMAMTDSTGASTGSYSGTGTGGPPPANAGAMDASMASLLAIVNRGEIDAGTLASTKARSADVKAYARAMLDEHKRALQQLSTLASTSGWTLPDSGAANSTAGGTLPAPTALDATVGQVQASQTKLKQELTAASGAAFDRAYITGQIAGHQQTLDLLRQYTQSVQSNPLRSHVQDVQNAVEKHLQQAQDLRGKLPQS